MAMQIKKLALTDSYQALPIIVKGPCPVWTDISNVGKVTLSLSTNPAATDIALIGPSQGITLNNNKTTIYAKSSQSSGDILYMIQN